MVDHQTEDEQLIEDSRQALERMGEEFLRAVPKPFRAAARELDLVKIWAAHARLTQTSLGKEALIEELTPKSDVMAIDHSLEEIRELREFVIAGESPSFAGISDISGTLRKIEISGSTMYVEEGFRVLSAMKAMRHVREYFSRRAKETPKLWKTAIQLFDDKILELHFDRVFDDTGAIRDTASPELARLRREIIQTSDLLRTRLSAILRKLTEGEFVQDAIITQREGRYVIPVKSEHKRRVPGFIHSVSQTGQTVFVEPSETLELNNELRSLEFAEQREVDKILRMLSDLLRDSVGPLNASLEAVAHLEAVYAKVQYAIKTDGHEARVEEQVSNRPRRIILRDARHPLLLEKLGREGAVPLTLELDDIRRTLVLTGPNAGGKTVLLKTLGLLTMMAQAGIPIPVQTDSYLPMMDRVYVEIGDMQSIADDLSTFSSHVTSLKRILDDVTRESLVLLDEIGGGTAPEEGGAIAEAILEHLTRIGAFTIATTHYGRLAAFAEASQGAINGSMEFSRETLRPTFRFRMGVPGSSHAFDIAERYGLKKGLIQRARDLRGDEGAKLDELVSSLEELQRDARERKRDSERELGAARIIRVEYERKLTEIEDIRATAKTRATKEAEEILSRANTFIERAVREAKEAAGKTAKAQQEEELRTLRARQEQERKELIKATEAAKPKPKVEKTEFTLEVGSNVKLRSNPGQTGKVISIKGNDVEIEIGSLRMRTKRDQLEVASSADARTKQRVNEREVSQTTKYMSEKLEPRIDIRGHYGDEAIPIVDSFLDDAAAHGLARVEIIHGIGTGALAKRINQHMKGHPHVAMYRYGEPQEGGSGVTIVELK